MRTPQRIDNTSQPRVPPSPGPFYFKQNPLINRDGTRKNKMAKLKKSVHSSAKPAVSPFLIYWNKENFVFLVAAIAIIILGFYLLSVGQWDSTVSLVAAPIILTIGYIVAVPFALLYTKKKTVKNTED